MQQKKSHTEAKQTHIQGIIGVTSRGIGYIAAEGYAEDIEIQTNFLNAASNGDEVEVLVHPKIQGQRVSGEVTNIVHRAKTEFVGVIDKPNGACFLVPDDRKMYRDIVLSPTESAKVKNGDKALIQIVSWGDAKKSPEGKILKVLGQKGSHNVEMESIVLERGFDTEFPPEVEKEAEKIAHEEKLHKDDEIKSRRDFRDTLTFTIDPVDAKDFDDAISFKPLPDGDYEIGVHIADVSHYVREGTALDREARKRGCSVYLVDRTIPMLPEVLSNDLCSLNPREDKFTFSSVFIMSKDGTIKDRWFGKTIINSDMRFSYESAQEVLNAGTGQYFTELDALNKVAKILQQQKFARGAIDFEKDEVRFELDPNGKPVRVYKKQRLETHKLVEEYMLLANREVAEYIFKAHKQKKGAAFIYRIHDMPDQEKIKDLSIFLRALGYNLEVKGKQITSKDIGALLEQVNGKAEESLIKTAAIRSMAKAVYSTKNIGHFGLAFQYYTHFTSPIRRYPDLLVHRLLFRHLKGGKIEQDEYTKYEKMAIDSSGKEVSAAEAERASIKYKQVEYMMEHIGEIFDGVVSGVSEWGVYVEEENTKCDGMVRLKEMKDDFYILDEKNYAIVGTKTKKKYTLGDKVKIKVMAADLDRKTLDYVFVD